MSDKMQSLYDEYKQAEEVLDDARVRFHEAIAERNRRRDAIRDAMSPGDVIEVRHDEGHAAKLLASSHPAIPGHVLYISVEGSVDGRSVLEFGRVPSGEKVTPRK